MRYLGEKAGAVSGAVGNLGSSMVQPDQALHGKPGHSMGRPAVSGSDQPHPTGIVMKTTRQVFDQV